MNHVGSIEDAARDAGNARMVKVWVVFAWFLLALLVYNKRERRSNERGARSPARLTDIIGLTAREATTSQIRQRLATLAIGLH